MRTFSALWRNGDFLKLWTAKTVSDFGSMVSGVALSFTAVLLLKATPAQLSLLMVANLLPRFLIGLIAGVWVDRLRRRPLMILADVGRAILLGSIPAAALLGALRIEQLYLVTLLTGMLNLLFDVADRSFLPTLVETEHLTEANSKLTATASVAEFSAFSLGGWLVQWFTGPIAVLLDSLSFLFSALFLSRIRKLEPPPTSHEDREPFWVELREGLATVRHHPLLASLAVGAFLLGISGGIFGTVVVAFMARDVGFAPGILGMIWAVGGITSLLGAMSAAGVTRRFGVGKSLCGGLVLAAVGGFATASANGVNWFSAGCLIAAQILSDPGYTVYEITQVSLRQSVVSERLQGRVNATFEFVGLGATLLGTLLGGLFGAKVGLRPLLVSGSTLTLLAAFWLAVSPLRRVKAIADLSQTDAILSAGNATP